MSNFLYAEQLVSSFLLNEVTTSKEGCIQSIKRLVESNLENSSIVFLDTFFLEMWKDAFQKVCAPAISNITENLEHSSEDEKLLLLLVPSFRQLVQFRKSCDELLHAIEGAIPERAVRLLENSLETWFSYKIASIVTPRFEEFLWKLAAKSFQRVRFESAGSDADDWPSKEFYTLCNYLESLGLSFLVLQILYSVILNQLELLLKVHAEKNFDSRVLPFLSTWLDNDVLTWLRWILGIRNDQNTWNSHLSNVSPVPYRQSPLLFERISPNQVNVMGEEEDTKRFKDWYRRKEKLYTQWYLRLDHLIAQQIARLRISEMFDIVVDYPDSLPALEDLKECLQKTDQKRELAKAFKLQLNTRLLHVGATTSDILATYVHAIHSLRIVDPAGNVLSYISKPVRKYLQNRSDTIRCIIYGITNEAEDETFRDLISLARNRTDEDEEALESKWNPQPADSPFDEYVSGMDDAFGILLSIYG